ncbi:hypothetical protein [Hymenobacter lucidus]|uniref:Secreted protein n=1 Tax=Hymenobacter lucidus TaxID=2880930 RepID=A0ABS8ALM3_9BACT|nr:hypothetical protein [Hymenobacter lucidus]MCB2407108.1 hypothetical protein [Hymenobacter lucidus]
MQSLFTFSLPLATATGHFAAAPLPSSTTVQGSILATKQEPAAKHTYKPREYASLATHRAQVLAQRRTAIRSSAKRW